MRPYKYKEERINEIKNASKRFGYIEDVADSICLRLDYVYEFCLRNKIKALPFRDPKNIHKINKVKRKELTDKLINRGLSLAKIGMETKLSRERVRQYILGSGQYEIWKKLRKQHIYEKNNDKQNNVERKNLIYNLLRAIVDKKKEGISEQEKFAFEKTIEYNPKIRNCRNYSFEIIYNLMMDYWNFKNNKNKKSLRKFGDDHNLGISGVSKVFKKLELETLGGYNRKTKIKINLPLDKKEAINRGYNLSMSCSDLSYFLKVPVYTIIPRFSNKKSRNNIDRNIIKFGREVKDILYYRTASQIYEAEYAGFTKNETLELLTISGEIYDYALDNKDKISDFIINSLKVLYSDRKIINPWVN